MLDLSSLMNKQQLWTTEEFFYHCLFDLVECLLWKSLWEFIIRVFLLLNFCFWESLVGTKKGLYLPASYSTQGLASVCWRVSWSCCFSCSWMRSRSCDLLLWKIGASLSSSAGTAGSCSIGHFQLKGNYNSHANFNLTMIISSLLMYGLSWTQQFGTLELWNACKNSWRCIS